MNMYSYTELDLQRQANEIKEAALQFLEKEGLLRDSAEDIASKYLFIITKPNCFGYLFDKVFNVKKDDKIEYRIVKTKW